MRVPPLSPVAEIYGVSTAAKRNDRSRLVARQRCPFLGRRCLKTRKSQPSVTIGTCTVMTGRTARSVIICPHRLLERQQVFTDCLHLLTLHEPGNELHVVPEVAVPGGSVDYFLASVRSGKVRDFVGWSCRRSILRARSGRPARNSSGTSGLHQLGRDGRDVVSA